MTQNDDAAKYQREAVEWMTRLQSGAATTADLAAFETWCRESPNHARAFSQTRHLMRAVDVAGTRVSQRQKLTASPLPRERQPVGRRGFLVAALSASAVAGGVAIVRPPFELWPSLDELRADYRTRIGEQRKISLADGLSIDMNTQTSIALRPEVGGVSHIELVAGEGMVDASRGALQVSAAMGSVRANGASFTIRRDGDAVIVTCVDGEVVVRCGAAVENLRQGWRLAYSGAGIGAAIAVDTAAATSWRQGYITFRDTKLSDVVAEINRYRRGRIVVLGEELSHRLVNVRFYLDRLDEVAEKLKTALGARATTLPGGVVVLS